MFPGAYYTASYWPGSYFSGTGEAVAAVVRAIKGLWSLHGISFKQRNIVKGEVK